MTISRILVCTVSTEFIIYLDCRCDGTVTVMLSCCSWTEPIKFFFLMKNSTLHRIRLLCVFVVKEMQELTERELKCGLNISHMNITFVKFFFICVVLF